MWRTVKEPKYDEVKVTYVSDGQVAIVSINRAKKYNAITY